MIFQTNQKYLSTNPEVNGGEIKSSSFSPLQGWAAMARSGDCIGRDERCVTKEEITWLQEAFDGNLVIPEERLAQNRERWKFSLIEKFIGHRVLDPELLARTL